MAVLGQKSQWMPTMRLKRSHIGNFLKKKVAGLKYVFRKKNVFRKWSSKLSKMGPNFGKIELRK